MVLLDSNNMEIEDITRIIEQTLVSSDLSKINSDNKGLFWKEQLKIVLSSLTLDFTGALEREIQAVNDYRTGELFRKFVFYVQGLKETTSEERHMFADEIVCHDDEMTLGSGSFSGISQQLLKRW